jgi:signal transduction histidine kinase
MKLHQHFTLNFLLIFLTSITLSGIVSYFTLENINVEQHVKNIKTKVELLKLHLTDVTNLEAFTLKVKEKTGDRLTLIDDDGIVIAESDFDAQEMENHSDRKEIKLARTNTEGYSIRYSNTVNKDFLYFASQYELHGKPIFIRLSTELTSINQEFFDMWLRITTLFLLSILIGFFVVYRLSKKIENEISKVTTTLDEISNKNYKAVVNANFAQEFTKIEEHIKKLSTKLEKREKQKRKYTAKIRLISKQRSDIISAISHEFKNPIASVIGYAQTLIEDPDAKTDIKVRFLEKIVKNSQKISYMIDRLSLATKFENGDLNPVKTRFDIYLLAHEIINTFKDNYPERVFDLQGSSLIVEADKTMSELVIVNLLENALKYSENDITLKIEDGFLHVIDKGIGIAPDEIEKVTNKFYRSNTMSWDNSIGLGLAIVKHILNLHHTKLEIQSKLGYGSDFYFKLT